MPEVYDIHPLSLLFPPMSEEEFSVLKESIKNNGLFQKITTYEGMIIDGRHRYKACLEVGVEPQFEEFHGESPVSFVAASNLERRHLSQSQKAAIALEFKPFFEEEAAKRMKAGVATHPQEGVNPEEIFPQGSRAPQARDLAGEKFGVSGRYIDEAETIREMDPEAFEAIKRGETTISAVKKAHVAHNSGDNEWYTPPEFIEAARAVMGDIDLDPASSAIANEAVGATQFFTEEDDGLTQEWHGRVWLNPPYAQPLIAQFTSTLVARFKDGRIEQAVVLVNNATETQWFQGMLSECSAVCFPAGRIRFLSPSGERGAPLQGQAILYFGDRAESFKDNFSLFGPTLWLI